jgi:GxxExxY protein
VPSVDGPDPLTGAIIGAAIEVQKALGPGLLESIYEECLSVELTDRGLTVKRQLLVPISYKGRTFECGFRLDLLVEDTVIVELKAIEKVLPVHEAQLLSHMKLLKKRVGLLINFNSALLRDGILRRVL